MLQALSLASAISVTSSGIPALSFRWVSSKAAWA